MRVPHWPESTTQPGGMLPGYLERMGAEISFPVIDGVRYCEVTGSSHINGLGDFDLTAAGEIAPSLAAILVFADKPTRMLGIGHLRGHETNRLESIGQRDHQRSGVMPVSFPTGWRSRRCRQRISGRLKWKPMRTIAWRRSLRCWG